MSEDLFRTQLHVVEKLAQAVLDNAIATKGVAEIQNQQSRLLEKIDERSEQGRKDAVENVKDHITAAIGTMEKHVTQTVGTVGNDLSNKLEFYKKPQFWIAMLLLFLGMITGSPLAVIVARNAGLVK